jgi:hypothetical protein
MLTVDDGHMGYNSKIKVEKIHIRKMNEGNKWIAQNA